MGITAKCLLLLVITDITTVSQKRHTHAQMIHMSKEANEHHYPLVAIIHEPQE
jgi:hypothetical protein